jgi:hypothetical protein
MKPPITSKGLQVIAAITMLGVALVLLTQYFGPYPRQLRTLAAMREHLAILRPVIEKDPRFTNVVINPSTACKYFITGELESEKDITDLERIIAESRPPVPSIFKVYVLPPEFRQQ